MNHLSPTVWLQIFVRQYFYELRECLAHHENIRHENFVCAFLMSLDKYFKPLLKRSSLPSPNGELSHIIPSSSIAAVNQEVSKMLPAVSTPVTRGNYAKFTLKQKAAIGNYAVLDGISAALCRFKTEFLELKWSTAIDCKNAVIKQKKIESSWGQESTEVAELVGKNRGRLPTLPEDISKDLIEYVRAMRESGGVVNTAIVIAAGMGMVKRRDPSLLECNGGHVTLKKSWAKYLLSKLNFTKHKAATKCKVDVKNFA